MQLAELLLNSSSCRCRLSKEAIYCLTVSVLYNRFGRCSEVSLQQLLVLLQFTTDSRLSTVSTALSWDSCSCWQQLQCHPLSLSLHLCPNPYLLLVSFGHSSCSCSCSFQMAMECSKQQLHLVVRLSDAVATNCNVIQHLPPLFFYSCETFITFFYFLLEILNSFQVSDCNVI